MTTSIILWKLGRMAFACSYEDDAVAAGVYAALRDVMDNGDEIVAIRDKGTVAKAEYHAGFHLTSTLPRAA
jgi:hypothetical protein